MQYLPTLYSFHDSQMATISLLLSHRATIKHTTSLSLDTTYSSHCCCSTLFLRSALSQHVSTCHITLLQLAVANGAANTSLTKPRAPATRSREVAARNDGHLRKRSALQHTFFPFLPRQIIYQYIRSHEAHNITNIHE
jgi:hypothetical protein